MIGVPKNDDMFMYTRRFHSVGEVSLKKLRLPWCYSPPMKVLTLPAWSSPSMKAWRRSNHSMVLRLPT